MLRIREVRKQKQVTLNELGIKVGKNVSALSRMERGITEVPCSLLIRIAKALEVQPCELLGSENGPGGLSGPETRDGEEGA